MNSRHAFSILVSVHIFFSFGIFINISKQPLINYTLPELWNANKATEKKISNPPFDFQKVRRIKIISIIRLVDSTASSDEHYRGCESWTMNAKQIKSACKMFKLISSEEQNLMYQVTPCKLVGEMEVDNRKFKYWLNAGGTLTLRSSEIAYYFGYVGKDHKNYFLSGKIDFSNE